MSLKIVVCDDQPHVRRVLQMKLEQSGWEVLTASNGKEALELVRSCKPQAVITDFSMPVMDGRELCHTLFEEGLLPAVRVLVVTSRADRESRSWVAALPGVSLLEKPLSPSQVRDWVQQATHTGKEVTG